MPIFKKATTLHELLLNKLMALYDAEIQITKAMPKLLKKVTSPDLVQALEEHMRETDGHVKRLEKCFTVLKVKPKKLKGDAIRGLADDASWVTTHVEKGPALDANLIAAVRYVEHYEVAGYSAAIEWARLMGHDKVADMLGQTLKEEEGGDQKLGQLAKTTINSQVEMGM